MGQRYENPLEKKEDCQFRLIRLVKRHGNDKSISYMTVTVDNTAETLQFFQENMKEVIHNVKMVKKLEAHDTRKLMEERLETMCMRLD